MKIGHVGHTDSYIEHVGRKDVGRMDWLPYLRIIYTKLGHWANAAHTGNIGSVLDQLWSPTPKYMLWWGSYWSYMY